MGFCVGDTEWIDKDLTWALSNTTCVSILNSMKEVISAEKKREGDNDVLTRAMEPGLHDEWKLHNGSKGFELSNVEQGYQQKLPLGHANLSPSSAVCDWSNSTDLYQGWPALYSTRNNPYAMFPGYQYGFSPGSQESFTTFPGISPSDATGLYQYPMSVLSQPLSETQDNLHMSSSQERMSFPSLRKLQVGHRGMQNRGRMAGGDIKSEVCSSEVTDSSTERSDSLRAAPVVLQEELVSNIIVRDHSRQGPVDAADFNFDVCWNQRSSTREPAASLRSERNRSGSDSSDLSDCITEAEVPSLRALSSGDSSITVRRNKETAALGRSFGLHQHHDTVQGSKRTVISDNSGQCREGSLGSKLKKRLDFQEPMAQRKQQPSPQEPKALDDSFYICSPSVYHEQRTKPTIRREVQGNQIYDRMSMQALQVNSKQALKTNSVTIKQCDPDDLLMMPKQRKRAPSQNLSDVMNIDIELLKSAEHSNLPNSKKTLMNSEPSQERVKKFLDHYNEKREAKIRGELSSSKRSEREGKLKAMREDLESKKSEMARARRPERTALQTEAQLRADKLRSYKAGLQKIKKEKEDEERRRLEELKAQRQERIAARSNLNSSTPQRRVSLKLPAKAVPPQNSRSSLPKSQAVTSNGKRTVHSLEFNSKGTPPRSRTLSKPAVNQVRSTALSVPRQMGKATIGFQPSMKIPSFKAPQSTKTVSVRSSSMFSAVSGGRENQRSRTSSMRKSEPSVITSKDPCSHPSLRSLRGQTSKSVKDVSKSLDEMPRERKPFLKKGSGAGSSGRSAQRPKPISPVKARVVDKRPSFWSGTKEAEVSGGAGRLISGVQTNCSASPVARNRSRRVNYTAKAEINDMNLSKSKQTEMYKVQSSIDLVNVNVDLKPLIATDLHNKEMVTPPTDCHQPKSSSVLQMNPRPPETDVNSHQGPPVDSTMSHLTQFDRSCTTNGDSSSSKQSIIFNTIFPIKNSYPESSISSGSVLRDYGKDSSTSQTPCEDGLNGFEKLVRFGRRSMHTEAGETAMRPREAGWDEILEHRSVEPKHALQPPIEPSKAIVTGGTDSVTLRGSASKASRSFSFLGTFRSKAAEVNWH